MIDDGRRGDRGARGKAGNIASLRNRADPRFPASLAKSTAVDLYHYVGITLCIAELFTVSVDVADHAMLIEPVRQTAERDAVYAF